MRAVCSFFSSHRVNISVPRFYPAPSPPGDGGVSLVERMTLVFRTLQVMSCHVVVLGAADNPRFCDEVWIGWVRKVREQGIGHQACKIVKTSLYCVCTYLKDIRPLAIHPLLYFTVSHPFIPSNTPSIRPRPQRKFGFCGGGAVAGNTRRHNRIGN